jgi:hypothetical protein
MLKPNPFETVLEFMAWWKLLNHSLARRGETEVGFSEARRCFDESGLTSHAYYCADRIAAERLADRAEILLRNFPAND